MKISENWLREFINPAANAHALAERLTLAGIEVTSVTDALPPLDRVVVGEVKSVLPHPDADKLNICQVEAGSGRLLQIVCGAPNVHAGIKAPVILPGGRLPDGSEIRKAKLRGTESEGMLCSAHELALTDDRLGLMVLPADTPVGKTLTAVLGGADKIMEIEVTPNRGDCLSVLGIARELGALYDQDLKIPDTKPIAAVIKDMLPVKVEAPEGCRAFAGRIIRDLNSRATTPLWLCERLRRSGVRPIHPVVDITQYVMLELGQPMHAYDCTHIEGGIVVRWARTGERIKLLEGSESELDKNVLVIADHRRVLGLAGIMGGSGSAVQDGTVDIYLECAWFSPTAISGRSRHLGLQTEAGYRFERGVDLQGQLRAMERATRLLMEITGGKPGPVTVMEEPRRQPSPVRLRRARLEKLLGIAVPGNDVVRILSRLGMPPQAAADGWDVVPPGYRFDIEVEEDLVEEVGRIHGYNLIPSLQYPGSASMARLPEKRLDMRRLQETLVQRGYQEVITYSFVDPELQRRLTGQQGIALANPIAADLAEMRLSLWVGLVQTLRYNRNRQQARVRIFETGLRFILEHNDIKQENVIAGLITGPQYPLQWGLPDRPADFADLKGDVEALLALSGNLERLEVLPAPHPALHPSQSAQLWLEGTDLGWLGVLHPQIAKILDIPSAVVFELKLEPLLIGRLPHSREVSRFPPIRRDLAVVVDETVTAAQLLQAARASGGAVVQDLRIFDIYRGPGIDSRRKSVALGLILQDSSRTLTNEAADAVMAQVAERLRCELGATIRD